MPTKEERAAQEMFFGDDWFSHVASAKPSGDGLTSIVTMRCADGAQRTFRVRIFSVRVGEVAEKQG